MKPYHKNPRQITKKQFDELKANLAYLGDLSGIVHDLNSDEIIGGNQRSAVFDVNKCEIEIVHRYDYPDEQGTVAQGFIIWDGKRYTYRQVRWTPKQCEQANITANRLGGDWDWDSLANGFDMDSLLSWGFDDVENIANAASLTAIQEEGETSSSDRNLGERRKQIKPVIYADEVADFERAILSTGLRNRGQALMEICRFYLENHEQTEG